jgi:cysteine sulfinate desulfinase/cysteine desulfurase-like protein
LTSIAGRYCFVPLVQGGGQERNMRSGTLPAPLIVGMGEACRIAKQELEVGVLCFCCSLVVL